MRCPECDSTNIDGADECWSCGASLRPAKVRRGGSQDWIVWMVGAAVLLLVVGLFMTAATAPTGGSSRGSGSTTATSSPVSTPSVPATGGSGPSAPASGTPAASSTAQP